MDITQILIAVVFYKVLEDTFDFDITKLFKKN